MEREVAQGRAMVDVAAVAAAAAGAMAAYHRMEIVKPFAFG